MIFKVGITGGIGVGKSSVAGLFADMGAAILSADAISAELCEPEQPPYIEIVKAFGKAILNSDARLNRAKLGNIVFNDDQQLKKLEAILHPAIFSTLHQRAEAQNAPYCLLDIPLLVGRQGQHAVQRILWVRTNLEIRKQRVKLRSGWSAAKTQAVIDKQPADAKLLAAADDILNNNTALRDLLPQVEKLHQIYLDLASRTPINTTANITPDPTPY